MSIVIRAFEQLCSARTIQEVQAIPDLVEIPAQYRMDDKVYPAIPFTLSGEEIQHLKQHNVIGDDGSIRISATADPLTRLLYAVLWKNGDLRKIRHIIDGIIGHQQQPGGNGLVFHQFGRFLTGEPNEPIIDQHVLRAFAIYQSGGDPVLEENWRKKNTIGKNDIQLIHDYKTWLQIGLTAQLRAVDGYTYHVDKVLFAVGKCIKNQNR